MDADDVRALVAAKWPEAMRSPLAQACKAFAATDGAACAIEFAGLQARATCADLQLVREEARQAAEACLNACGGWTVETLGHNIESAMGGRLDADECDAVAREALGATRR